MHVVQYVTLQGINNGFTQRGGSKEWPGGHGVAPVRALPPASPYKIGCKVARLHNSCRPIHSVASHSWSQVTPLTQSCIMLSGIPTLLATTNDPVSLTDI